VKKEGGLESFGTESKGNPINRGKKSEQSYCPSEAGNVSKKLVKRGPQTPCHQDTDPEEEGKKKKKDPLMGTGGV